MTNDSKCRRCFVKVAYPFELHYIKEDEEEKVKLLNFCSYCFSDIFGKVDFKQDYDFYALPLCEECNTLCRVNDCVLMVNTMTELEHEFASRVCYHKQCFVENCSSKFLKNIYLDFNNVRHLSREQVTV